MTNFIIKLFIKDHQNTALPHVRTQYGNLSGIVGIIINFILFLGKFFIGYFTFSISIKADAINNLSDAGSSLIELLSFKIASKPADREHPFGHARIEYIASLIVSFLVLIIGIELFKSSIQKIITPTESDFGTVSVIVLTISVVMKLWLYLFNRKISEMINSSVVKATATDSLSDALSTFAVIISIIISKYTGFNTDGYMGLIVAILIFISGIKILNETKNHILGTAPDAAIIDSIEQCVKKYSGVCGVHDLVVHNYGPGRCFASLHVEVDGREDIFISHDMIDNIEREIENSLGIQCVIHLDPISANDETTVMLKEKLNEIAKSLSSDLSIHDFRLVEGITHSNLIFDIVVPYECKYANHEIKSYIDDEIKKVDEKYMTVITFDKC